MSTGQWNPPEFNAGDRVSAGKLTKLTGMAGRGKSGDGDYIDERGVHTAEYPQVETWAFELGAELTQWTKTPVLAYRRFIDPSANSGWGAYVTDCAASSQFYVVDLREVGYWGPVGQTGAALIVQVQNGTLGIIVDLRCPVSCICGSDTVAPACGE